MATVINNPGNGEESSSGVGIIVSIIVFIVVIGLFFVYVLPAIRDGSSAESDGSIDINVELPAGNDVPSPTPTPETP
jgi:hypothetical protein